MMSIQTIKHVCTNVIKSQARVISALPKSKTKNHCVISCKRRKFDHYRNTVYEKLNAVPLASKGWTHQKSKGDFFTVNPIPEEYQEETVPFEELGIHSDLTAALKKRGIGEATELQARAIPMVADNDRHLLLSAETGCGKTIAYLLPIVQSLIGEKPEEMNTPRALIVVPNRELAYQVGEVAQMLSEPVGVDVKVVVGGSTKKKMLNPEFENIDILVATPGALGKLSNIGLYKLNQVAYTVLDEADTLIDDSFVDRMTGIIKRVSQSKMVLVSATLPKNLPDVLKPMEMSMDHCTSPKLHKPLLNITQKFLRLTKSARPAHLIQLAKKNKSPMVVFSNRNETSNWVALFLRENGVPCANISGDMHYAIRIEQWNSFIGGEARILSATDIGSRGLDTTQVRHVVNYDFPLYAADYLHRVGRVGRLGGVDACRVTNFISGVREVPLVQEIEMAIRRNQPLLNVDGNITNLVNRMIMKKKRQEAL